jgi:hypothetical protein
LTNHVALSIILPIPSPNPLFGDNIVRSPIRAAFVVTLLVAFSSVSSADDLKGPVDHALLERNAPGGTFLFEKKIDHQSKVVIHAPGGIISFSTPSKPTDEGSKIDGQSHVLLEARNITFNAKIDGQSWVLMIVSKGGTVTARDKIIGKSKIFWTKSNPGDPPPTINLSPEDGSIVKEITNATEWEALVKKHITDYRVPKP